MAGKRVKKKTGGSGTGKGKHPRPSRSSHDLLEAFLGACRLRGHKPNSIATQRGILQRYFGWLQERGLSHPGEADGADLEAFSVWLLNERRYRGQKLSSSARARYTGTLKEFYRFCVAEGELFSSPAALLRHPKQPHRIIRDILTVEETWALLDAAGGVQPGEVRDHVALRILLFCGLRVGELTSLMLGEVNLAEREILIRMGKGSKDRLVFMDRHTREKVADYLVSARPALVTREDPGTLLLNDKGGALSGDSIRKRLKLYRDAAGIGHHITCHSLRRTFCTLLVSAGCNIKAISDLAGHKRLKTTQRYAQIQDGELAGAYRSAHPRSGS